jgi:cytochrome c2
MRKLNNSPDRQVRLVLGLKVCVAAATALALISPPAASAELGDIPRGRAYAEAVCAQCHAVAPADMTSPRSEATPFTIISQTPGINDRALAAFLQTPHAAMPNLVVTGQDRDDLIAYIISLRGKQ